MESSRIDRIRFNLKPLRVRLFGHEIYQQLETLEDIREFMEHHVFAVWDNISQLKALQRKLSCVFTEWMPTPYKVSTRIINEMVLEDESDDDGKDGYKSHFELYIDAMQQAGAKTHLIDRFLVLLQEEEHLDIVLGKINLPDSIKSYLRVNWEISHSGQPHEMAAAFFLGREDVIPELFHKLGDDLIFHHPQKLERMKDYLMRHTKKDKKEHEQRISAVLNELCGEDEEKWREAEIAARMALEARFTLWDGMLLLSV